MVLLSAKLFVHSCKKHHSSYSHNKNTQDSFDTNYKTTFPSSIIHSKQIIKHIFHLLSSGTMKTLEYSLSVKMCWESAVCSHELRFYYLWCWSRPSWRRVAPGSSWAALSWRSWDLCGGAAGRPSTGPVWVANTWPKVANRDKVSFVSESHPTRSQNHLETSQWAENYNQSDAVITPKLLSPSWPQVNIQIASATGAWTTNTTSSGKTAENVG